MKRLIPSAVFGVLIFGYLTYDALNKKVNEVEYFPICGDQVRSNTTRLECDEVPENETYHLTELSELETIWFNDSDVGAPTWERLRGLENLERVSIVNKWPKPVRDLDALTSLTQVKSLTVNNGEIKDEDLSKFASMTNLR